MTKQATQRPPSPGAIRPGLQRRFLLTLHRSSGIVFGLRAFVTFKKNAPFGALEMILEFTDYMLIKAGALIFLAACYGFYRGWTGKDK